MKDEVLSDEQLDGVAGGSMTENRDDLRFLRDVGILKGDFNTENEDGMKYQLKTEWAKVGVVTIPRTDNGNNEYYDAKGNQIARADAFKIAAKAMRSKIDYNQYLC